MVTHGSQRVDLHLTDDLNDDATYSLFQRRTTM